MAPGFSSAQTETKGPDAIAAHNTSPHQDLATSRSLTTDDGLSVIAAALDSRVRLYSGNDCSHLVHAIYARAGFPYSYVSSSALYAGTKEFQRVKRAQPGDLVVWPGHVGIVVNPARHEFFSTLSSGPGIDTYDAPVLETARTFAILPLHQDPGAICVASFGASPSEQVE